MAADKDKNSPEYGILNKEFKVANTEEKRKVKWVLWKKKTNHGLYQLVLRTVRESLHGCTKRKRPI